MVENADFSDCELPQPVKKNGRFQMPWEFTIPSFGGLLKFFRAPDHSNIPGAKEVSSFHIAHIYKLPFNDTVLWLLHLLILKCDKLLCKDECHYTAFIAFSSSFDSCEK